MPYTDSDPEEVVVALVGVWLHDPLDPEGTSRNYPYGGAARSLSVDTMGQASYYAGRSAPVVDYGEHEEVKLSCKVVIPHGVTWRSDVDGLRSLATSRGPLVLRDNRGRVVTGTLADYAEADEPFGTTVSFVVTQVAA